MDVLQVLDVARSVENGEFIVTIRAVGNKRAGAEVQVQDASVATDQLIGTAAAMGVDVEDPDRARDELGSTRGGH